MELNTREDRVAAAGEYVLGTLDAEERAAVESAAANDAELRSELGWWEGRLGLLGVRLRQVAPRPMVWLDIRARTLDAGSRVTALPTAQPRPAPSNRFAWLATAASLVLGVALVVQLQKEPPAPVVVTREVPVEVKVPTAAVSYVALLQVPKSTMNWTVSVTPDTREIVVRAAGDVPEAAKDLDAELWVITDDGPVSLGVIPKEGETRYAYTPDAGVTAGRTLAVSLEPPGGSPTGQPTGPVVTSGVVLQAG